MHNRDLVLEILEQIYDSTQKILRRVKPISSANENISRCSRKSKLIVIQRLKTKILYFRFLGFQLI
jgi:hypothetical protein